LHGVEPRHPDPVLRVPETSAGVAAIPDFAALHPGYDRRYRAFMRPADAGSPTQMPHATARIEDGCGHRALR